MARSGGHGAVRQVKDCATCDAKLSAVLADNRPVDIYLVDSRGSDDALRSWAQDHPFLWKKVRKRQITLNAAVVDALW